MLYRILSLTFQSSFPNYDLQNGSICFDISSEDYRFMIDIASISLCVCMNIKAMRYDQFYYVHYAVMIICHLSWINLGEI